MTHHQFIYIFAKPPYVFDSSPFRSLKSEITRRSSYRSPSSSPAVVAVPRRHLELRRRPLPRGGRGTSAACAPRASGAERSSRPDRRPHRQSSPSVAPPSPFAPSRRAGSLCRLGFPGRWGEEALPPDWPDPRCLLRS
jgi:hypothetical protein